MINIVIALHCEAKPIIETLKLKKISDQKTLFPIFVNKDKTVNLIISGVGKIKSAIASTYLGLWAKNKSHACFLNIGIAGAQKLNIGEILLINKLSEASTKRNWYPFTAHLKINQRSSLITHDVPQTSYPDTDLVDMEGTAFYQAATSFVLQEQVQILKIISDNSMDTQQGLNEIKVKELIQGNIDVISNFISQLSNFSASEAALNREPLLVDFLSKWHFTHTQNLQLQEYLRRWSFHFQQEDAFLYCQNETNANQVINKMISKLDYANSLY